MKKKAICCAIAAASMFVFPALAQESENIDELVITGSRLVSGEDSTSPVTVIDSEEFFTQPTPDLAEFVYDQPMNIGVEPRVDTGTGSGRSSGNRNPGVDLRGFGRHNTLTLVNGLRTVPSAPDLDGWQSVDINQTIPRIATTRAEIMMDGGSALYGTDAVAGVVNLIPNYGYEGLKIEGNYSGDMNALSNGRSNLAVMFGVNSGDTDMVAALEWSRTQYLNEYMTEYDGYQADNPGATGDDLSTRPRDYFGYEPTGSRDEFADPLCGEADLLGLSVAEAGGIYTSRGTDVCSYYTERTPDVVNNDTTTLTALFAVEHRVSDSLSLQTDFTVSRKDQSGVRHGVASTWGGSSADFLLPNDHPGIAYNRYLVQNDTDATNDGNWDNPGGAWEWIYPTQGFIGQPMDQGYKSDVVRGSLALSYALNDDWTIDFGTTQGMSLIQNEYRAGVWDRVIAGLGGLGGGACNPVTGTPGVGGCTYLNPMYNALDSRASGAGFDTANSEAMLDWAFPNMQTDYTTTLSVLNASISGFLPLELGGGRIGLAAGLETRKESLEVDFDTLQESGAFEDFRDISDPTEILGFNVDYKGDQTVNALFVEMSLPVTDEVMVQVAGRYDDYDSGYSSFSPKLGVNWSVTPDLTLRASYGESFKAPTITHLNGTLVRSSSADMFNAFEADNILYGDSTDLANLYNVNMSTQQRGATDIDPQTSQSISFGADWAATDWLDVGVDYVNIRLEDMIEIPRAPDVILTPGCYDEVSYADDPAYFEALATLNGFDWTDTALQIEDADGNDVTIDLTDPQYRQALRPNTSCFEVDANGIPTLAYLTAWNTEYMEFEGVDVNLSMSFDTDWGRVSLRPTLSTILDYRLKEAFLPEEDIVGVSSTLTRRGYSEYRATLPVTWSLDEHSVTARVRWASDIISSSGRTTYTGPVTWDLNYAYSFSEQARVSLYVQNVENLLPSSQVGYFPTNQRQMGAQFQYEF